MAETDVAKERIAYLKLWLGIIVVTDISLVGWIVSNAGRLNILLFSAACSAAVLMTTEIVYVHFRIERYIAKLRGS